MQSLFIGLLTSILMLLNTIIGMIPLTLMALLKIAIPLPGFRKYCSSAIVRVAEGWAEMCKRIFALTTSTRWDIRGAENLDSSKSYMIISNHQSWVDIPALIQTFNKKIPYFKFFLKKELVWVPLLGLAWWALDYPFMKRYSKTYLKKYPHRKGADFEITKESCEKFKDTPVSLMNFLEGTRFTEEKSHRQSSPYRHLLRPKSGGIAFAVQIMGQQVKHVLDVTVVYPEGEVPGFWSLLSGQVSSVIVDVRQLELDEDLLMGNYEEDVEFRKRFHRWVAALWQQKDDNIGRLRQELPSS
ncbi:acyltransferase [Gammaproteobacteria bacterium 42_54_T18]|nr:acyltransferase [Gammaproteobacteria bacterium 42_54_T18]